MPKARSHRNRLIKHGESLCGEDDAGWDASPTDSTQLIVHELGGVGHAILDRELERGHAKGTELSDVCASLDQLPDTSHVAHLCREMKRCQPALI